MTEEIKKGIYKKIFEVMKNVEYIPKDGNVEYKGIKYKYLSAEKIVENIRAEIIKQKLVMFPIRTEVTHQSETEKDILITYRLVDTDDGSFIDIQVAGGGYDSADKKTYKALTGAYKYALRQTFMIETGYDDPDKTPSGKLAKSKKNRTSEKPENEIDEELNELLDLAFTSEKTKEAFLKSFEGDNGKLKEILNKRIKREVNDE